MKMQVHRFAAFAVLLLAACSGGSDDHAMPAPALFALSRDQISVGQSLEFIGEGYLTGAEGSTEIELEGQYLTDGGSHPVSLRLRPVPGSDTRLVVPYFGPYDIPFSPTGDQLGTFEGTATAVNIGSVGDEVASRPLPVSLRVAPSIVVRALEPVAADCQEPSTRLLGGYRYRIVAEAVGIEPVGFTLEIFDEPDAPARQVFQRPADGSTASFGDDGDVTLAAAPEGQVFYVARVRIAARDAAGGKTSSEYAIGVHRPIEYIDNQLVQVGQIEAALPVAGCLAGGADGRQVGYQEGDPDLRDRHIATSWNESWIETHSDAFSQPEENQVSLRFRQTASEGWTAEWKDGEVIVGQVGATAAAEWAVRQSFGAGAPGSWPVGHDLSSGDSEAWAYDHSAADLVIGAGGFWRIASSDVISSQVSADVIPNMFGVWYRQATRLVRPGTIVAYDLCGEPVVTAEASFIDYTWDVSLAQAAQCPPFPEPDMPAEECFIAPCSQ